MIPIELLQKSSSRLYVFYKIAVLKNFTKFNSSLQLYYQMILAQVFSCEFYKILKNIFSI